jgi:DNA-binding PadR family transcriptional regulator
MQKGELECFVLGLIWQHGPCSPYQVRRILLDSPSAHWSGSAGAIYPLIRRLEKQGAVTGKAARDGKRRRREYAITAKGRTMLRRWLGPPLSEAAVTVTSDPLRTRARFLGLLSAAEREVWLAEAHAALERVLAAVERWDERYGGLGDPHLGALTAHAERETAARKAWLADLRAIKPSSSASSGPARRGSRRRGPGRRPA